MFKYSSLKKKTPPPPPGVHPFSPYIDPNMAIQGFQVEATVIEIGNWFLAYSLLFGHIS